MPSEDAEKVLGRIDALRATHGNADLAAAFNTVEDLLEASPGKYVEKEVYFLTNLQRTTWVPRQPAALAATVQKIQAHAKTAAVLDVGQDGAENLAGSHCACLGDGRSAVVVIALYAAHAALIERLVRA